MTTCPECDGDGRIVIGEGPYYAPMGEEGGQHMGMAHCETCLGTGEVPPWDDPSLSFEDQRREYRLSYEDDRWREK